MRLRQLHLGMLLGAGLLMTPSFAATQADYLVTRAKQPVTTLRADRPAAAQYSALAGKVVELDGVVNGLVSGATKSNTTYSGYLLKLDSGQTVTVAETREHDTAVGGNVRVLARIPASGSVLTELAEMPSVEAKTPAAKKADGPTLNQQFTKAIPPKAFVAQAKKAQPQAVKQAAPKKAAPAKAAPAKKHAAPRRKAAASRQAAPASSQVRAYAQKIQRYNGKISSATATKIAQNVLDKSRKYGVDPKLVFAVLAQESRFNPQAVSHAGARGLGQLMPATARSLGVKNSFDIAQNVEGTVRYLDEMLNTFGGDTRRALAAYNAGPGNVRRYGGIPPFRETQNYVSKISSHYSQLKGGLL
ncbi:MAG: lytic transglycosylase domain-containing protein [Armatimonadota bacterium]